jgi:hypothetical protein
MPIRSLVTPGEFDDEAFEAMAAACELPTRHSTTRANQK